MDVLHHDLEAIEKLGFCVLYFVYKVFSKIFIHNTVRCSKKCKKLKQQNGQASILLVYQIIIEIMNRFLMRKVYFYRKRDKTFSQRKLSWENHFKEEYCCNMKICRCQCWPDKRPVLTALDGWLGLKLSRSPCRARTDDFVISTFEDLPATSPIINESDDLRVVAEA